jgi:hypothetical protein
VEFERGKIICNISSISASKESSIENRLPNPEVYQMYIDKKILAIALLIVCLPLTMIVLAAGKDDIKSNSPESKLIENCLAKMDNLKSASIKVDGEFHAKPQKAVEFSFDGVIQMPGNIDGTMFLSAKDFMIRGRTISIEGKSWFFNPMDEKWEKSDPNQFHIKSENPLFSIPQILLLMSSFPEYLNNGIQSTQEVFNGRKTTNLKFDFNLEELRRDGLNSAQSDELTFLANFLTGETATASMWIDSQTGYLAGLEFAVDEVESKKTPVSVKVELDDYNTKVTIEEPDM